MEFTDHGGDRFYISEQEVADWRPSSSGPPSSSSSAPFRWNDGGGDRGGGCSVEKELMFDKVVTPSDVGKLNRLVIPKQHAEKHFPLDAGASRSGLLLSFEDRNGESWRFRYSYWSSSQSYVMTKGWSRFVKEKRLGAGDTVSFARGVGESGRDRLYIDWKRRPEIRRRDLPGFPLQYPGNLSFSRPWGGGHLFTPPPAPPPPMMFHHQFQGYGYNAGSQTTGQLIFFQSPATGQQLGQVQHGSRLLDSVLAVDQCQATASRGVRLFGVNLASHEGEGDAAAAAAAAAAGGGSSEEGTSMSLSRSQDSSILLRRPLQHSSVESSMASSSSTSKEQHSSLDLDL